ncbi:chloride channel protein [Aeoliella mucimassa]|uniref:H(+)/Cl(-) exchange transporter ClcA n=1 Tax=Aeoliella mucimassa TaxID=2527972 RepID=A0A518ANL5_9BACT|nr:chloride channel protein [Aeoliella mucimassa]QDU56308.1 H(+)/Cl(-) exchange transporter ClcA [Aeoliella mucimassa]
MTQIASQLFNQVRTWWTSLSHRGAIEGQALLVFLAAFCGLLAGYGAVIFTFIIEFVTSHTYGGAVNRMSESQWWGLAVLVSPAIGILAVAAITRRWAPAAQSHGVPEVICSVARHDGVIPPRVGFIKVIASGLTIGMGGAVGREGPIVQIGATLGSVFGQKFRLSARNIKLLVAAGAGAGISATFHAPLAGVIFASEIILGDFAVQSLTPIVIACVIADIVQVHVGEHRFEPAFQDLNYDFGGAWLQLPSFLLLGLIAGLVAVGFIKLLYWIEDVCREWLPVWWKRAIVIGLLIGAAGVLYPHVPPHLSDVRATEMAEGEQPMPPLLGVGYGVVDHALHLQPTKAGVDPDLPHYTPDKQVLVAPNQMIQEFIWLLPLVFLKPLVTSLTLGGGGSGGVFAPSLYIGATLGACIGIVMQWILPEYTPSPGMYAIVGMGAVVAGTTHGTLSAILIVYEMTGRYEIILPIMAAAGLSSLVASMMEPDSIYYKKLTRRGDIIARGHDLHALDHIMVRDVMVRVFPSLKHTDTVPEIVRIARENPDIESLPVNDEEGKLIGIIRAEDLHRVLDSDISPHLVNAEDIALRAPISVEPSENLIEALRDFGTRDVETLPVEVGKGANRRLVGLLLRSDVMSRYRQEMLNGH